MDRVLRGEALRIGFWPGTTGQNVEQPVDTALAGLEGARVVGASESD